MSKKLISLTQDYILESRFVENKVKNPNEEHSFIPEWIDKEKGTVKGKRYVDKITFFQPLYDNNGYHTGKFMHVELSVKDMKKLIEEVLKIEAHEITSHYTGDDLPF